MPPQPSTSTAAGDGAAPPPQAFAATGSPGGRANEHDTGWTTASPTDASPAPPPVEKWPAPEPPRWRFVAEARKSRGYSSQNAGKTVRGRSSAELGADYVAPEFTLERPTRAALEVGDLEYTPPPKGAPAIELPEVGRIAFHEAARIGTDAPAGTFPGLPAPQGAEPPAIKASKEWDTALEAGAKKERALPWQGGGDVLDSYAMPGDGTVSKTSGGVGKIESQGVGGNTDSFDGEIALGVGVSDVDEHGHAREGALFPHGGGSAAGGKGVRGLFAPTDSADKDAAKKRRCLLLLLLIPLLLGILVAVLLGRGGGGDEDTVVAGVLGAAMLPPLVLVNETNATAVPSSHPSAAPSPSAQEEQATPSPSARPTAKPTCGATAHDFHLCLALDMSGSVCNGDTDSDCLECRIGFLESVLPMFFTPDCRDGSVSEDTCCDNFARVQDFAALLVDSLEDVPADKSFSLVQFATTAQLARGPSSAAQTLAVIEQLDYTGGQTNHAAAIRQCQDALPATGGGKNAIVLVTDGLSTEPEGEAADAAEAAAGRAKAAGTLVTPVFIDRENDEDARSFMGRISSDGRVFDVTDFGSLDSLRDQLVEQVSCS